MSVADDPLTRLRELKPLRELPLGERQRLGVTREGRSRPKVIARRPEPDDYLDEVAQLRAKAMAVDPVVTVARAPERASEVFDQTLFELASECAALSWEIRQAERLGKDVGSLCSRRISGLTQIGSLVSERARWRSGDFDTRSAEFGKIVADFMRMFRETAEETVPDPERFIAMYEAKLAGWEDRIDPPRGDRSR